MPRQYLYDWENPILSVEGFVTDYIVWRLAIDGFEWRGAPEVPEGAEELHHFMRMLCFDCEEGKRQIGDEIGFNAWKEFVDRVDQTYRGLMGYVRMISMITTAGMICLRKAKKGRNTDIGIVARYTATYVKKGIRQSWRIWKMSWADFKTWSTVTLNQRFSRSRPSRRYRLLARRKLLQPPSPHSSFSLPVLTAGICVLGALVVFRIIVKRH